jgi:hypothetical protein
MSISESRLPAGLSPRAPWKPQPSLVLSAQLAALAVTGLIVWRAALSTRLVHPTLAGAAGQACGIALLGLLCSGAIMIAFQLLSLPTAKRSFTRIRDASNFAADRANRRLAGANRCPVLPFTSGRLGRGARICDRYNATALFPMARTGKCNSFEHLASILRKRSRFGSANHVGGSFGRNLAIGGNAAVLQCGRARVVVSGYRHLSPASAGQRAEVAWANCADVGVSDWADDRRTNDWFRFRCRSECRARSQSASQSPRSCNHALRTATSIEGRRGHG